MSRDEELYRQLLRTAEQVMGLVLSDSITFVQKMGLKPVLDYAQFLAHFEIPINEVVFPVDRLPNASGVKLTGDPTEYRKSLQTRLRLQTN
jgi:hypothetical protein